MAEQQGPIKPDYEGEQPIGAASSHGRSPEYDSLKALLEHVVAMAYAGRPVHQQFNNVNDVQVGGGNVPQNDIRMGNLPTRMNPIFGGKLEYRPNENFAMNLDGWYQKPGLSPNKAEGNKAYDQVLMALAANLALRYPNKTGITPYVGGGPAAVYTRQNDNIGQSPGPLDFGLHAYGGLEKQFTDALSAFLEAKYLNTGISPRDQQGAFRGHFHELGLVGGLGYKFGQDKDK